MRATILPSALKAGLAWIKPARAGKTFLPVLENVLIQAHSKRKVDLTATNLEISATVALGAKVDKPGSTTIAFKDLETLTKTLPNELLELQIKRNGKLAIVQGTKTIVVRTITADDFPHWPTAKGKTYKALNSFTDGCKFVQHAMAKDNARPALNFVEAKGGYLRGVDGYRLAIAPGFGGEAMIPAALVRFVARTKELPTKVAISDDCVTVWFGLHSVTGKQHEGAFPNCDEIMPKSPAWTIKVDFHALLKRAELIAKLKPSRHAIIFRPKRGRLYIEAKAEEMEFSDCIVAKVQGKVEPFAMNVNYLLDALRARKAYMDDGWLKIKGQGANTGMVFTDQHTRFVELIMPIFLSS